MCCNQPFNQPCNHSCNQQQTVSVISYLAQRPCRLPAAFYGTRGCCCNSIAVVLPQRSLCSRSRPNTPMRRCWKPKPLCNRSSLILPIIRGALCISKMMRMALYSPSPMNRHANKRSSFVFRSVKVMCNGRYNKQD